MKPTQQEIIELAREHATRYTNRHYPDKPVFTFTQDALQKVIELALERFGAGDGEPVAWIYWHPSDDTFDGPDTIHKKAVSRFTDDTRLTMQRKGWRFEPLYTHPSPTDLRAEYLRGLEDAASIVENADTPDCGGWTTCGIADAIRELKGK